MDGDEHVSHGRNIDSAESETHMNLSQQSTLLGAVKVSGIPARTRTRSDHLTFIANRLKLSSIIRMRLLTELREVGMTQLKEVISRHGITQPSLYPLSSSVDASLEYLVDRNKQRAYSDLLHSSKMTLADLVRMIRGETSQDSRPNKALMIPHSHKWKDFVYKSQWESTVSNGVIPKWLNQPKPQLVPPKNHPTIKRALNTLVKNLRKGQDNDQYLILDIELAGTIPGLVCSPFGAVPKGDKPLEEDCRIIHDLSFPAGESINDNTDLTASVPINYDGVRDMVKRALALANFTKREIKFMSGDVASAFRHIPINAEFVQYFAGTVPELGILVIDLCCPFGWCNSPAEYWIAGSAISFIYSSTPLSQSAFDQGYRAPLEGQAWCDDHNCIEPEVGTRLEEANLALRSAMIEVLGPHAINEEKFTRWSSTGSSLGLHWDFKKFELRMPPHKIEKATCRINAVFASHITTARSLNKLMGSLRHVSACLKPAVAFFQRVATLQRFARGKRFVVIPQDVREDLRWFKAVLQTERLNRVSFRMFLDVQPPQYHIFMDASDLGLCALFPEKRQYLLVKFSEEELAMINESKDQKVFALSINIREFMSAAFAALVWSPLFVNNSGETTHVRFWLDNTAAIAWNNKKASRHSFGQLLIRLLAFHEVRYGLHFSASHIPGIDNEIADAGSRIWDSPAMSDKFANYTLHWSQVFIPESWRDLSAVWEHYCEQGL